MKRNRNYKRLAIGIAGGAGLMGLGYLAAQKFKAKTEPKPAPVLPVENMIALSPADSTSEWQFAESPSIGRRRSRASVTPAAVSAFPVMPSVQASSSAVTPTKKRQLRQRTTRKPQVSPSLAAIPEEQQLSFGLQQEQQVPEPAPVTMASALFSESELKDLDKILGTTTEVPPPSKEKTPPPPPPPPASPPKVTAEAAPAVAAVVPPPASVLTLLPTIPEPVSTSEAVALGNASLAMIPQQVATRQKLNLKPVTLPPEANQPVPETPPPAVRKMARTRQQKALQETKEKTLEPKPADLTETKLLLEEKQAPVFVAFPALKDLEKYGIDLGILESQNTVNKCAVFHDVTIDFNKAMGSGSFGYTYQACINETGPRSLRGTCGYVAKFIRIETIEQVRSFLLESFIAIYAGQHDIGPAVKGRFICQVSNDITRKRKRDKTGSYGVIISEALAGDPPRGMAMSLASFKLLLARVQKMHRELGIVHGDLFERNILRYSMRPPYDYKIIDFGVSWLIDPTKDTETTNLISFGEMCGLFFGDARPDHEYKFPLVFDSVATKQQAWDWMRSNSGLNDDLQKTAFLYLTRGITNRYNFDRRTLRLHDVNKLIVQMTQNLQRDSKNHAGNFMALILQVMLPIMIEVGHVKERAMMVYMTKYVTYKDSLDVFTHAYNAYVLKKT